MENPSFDPEHDYVPDINPEIPYPEVKDPGTAETEVSNSPIGIRHDHDGTMEIITTELPYGCTMQGWLDDAQPDGSRIYNAGYVRVNPVLRKQGIGQRLIRASLAYAIDHDATKLRAEVVNEASLKVYAELLGHELEYQDDDPSSTGHKLVDLPITNKQAIASLDRAGKVEVNSEDRKHGLIVSADLSDLDVSDWERPTAQG